MTISSTVIRWPYTGDGSTKPFAYANKIFATSELDVYIDGVLKVLITDYTVSNVGEAGGGLVTFVTAPANLASVVIVLDVAAQQGTDYDVTDTFSSASHENGLDRLTLVALQMEDLLENRTLALADSDAAVSIGRLPNAAARASKALGFDASGDPIAQAAPAGTTNVSVFMATVLDDTTAAAARTTLGIDGASGNIASGDLAALAIVTAKIADDAVTMDKVSNAIAAGTFLSLYNLPA